MVEELELGFCATQWMFCPSMELTHTSIQSLCWPHLNSDEFEWWNVDSFSWIKNYVCQIHGLGERKRGM